MDSLSLFTSRICFEIRIANDVVCGTWVYMQHFRMFKWPRSLDQSPYYLHNMKWTRLFGHLVCCPWLEELACSPVVEIKVWHGIHTDPTTVQQIDIGGGAGIKYRMSIKTCPTFIYAHYTWGTIFVKPNASAATVVYNMQYNQRKF